MLDLRGDHCRACDLVHHLSPGAFRQRGVTLSSVVLLDGQPVLCPCIHPLTHMIWYRNHLLSVGVPPFAYPTEFLTYHRVMLFLNILDMCFSLLTVSPS